MSAHLERARVLLAQSRHADAEREAMQSLAVEPGNPEALALLALSRSHLKKSREAIAAAAEAVGLAPEIPHFHYVHGLVLHHADRYDEAFVAVQEALRLDPSDPDSFSLLAAIELTRRRWQPALEAAERALALNAEHVEAANFRAMALVRLGRKAEAMATVDFALEREPDNATSHANQGWNCLHRNEPRQAQEHFREALRLDPELDYAREGMMEALKARNLVYRGMLAYFLWIGRQSQGLQWALIAGVFLLSGKFDDLIAYHPLFWVPVILFYVFIYLSWTAVPMFNLLLRMNRFGRYLLTPDQRTGSNWFGGVLLAAAACFVSVFFGGKSAAVIGSMMLVALSICVAATFNREGRNRVILAVASTALAGVGGHACYLIATGQTEKARESVHFFINGFLIFQVGTIFLRR